MGSAEQRGKERKWPRSRSVDSEDRKFSGTLPALRRGSLVSGRTRTSSTINTHNVDTKDGQDGDGVNSNARKEDTAATRCCDVRGGEGIDRHHASTLMRAATSPNKISGCVHVAVV